MSTHTGTILQRFYEQASELEPRPDEVKRVLARVSRAHNARQRRPSRQVVAFAGVLLVAATLGLVPAGRAAVGDLVGSLDSFFSGGPAPGQPVGAGDSPSWFDDLGVAPGSARIVVSSGAERLYAYRNAETNDICFMFGGSLSMCPNDANALRAQLENNPVYFLGPTPLGSDGKEALWGLAQSDVAQIELTYKEGGQPQAVTLENNAFVVLTDPSRTPETLIARDAQGTLLMTVDVNKGVWRFCVGRAAETACS